MAGAGGNFAGAAVGVDAPATPLSPAPPKVRLNGVRWAHFSSTTGRAICRLSVGKVLPASKRSGPFILPAPGYELRQVAIDIIPENCTEKDWDTLAGILAELRRFTMREAITLRLLDESGDNTRAEWRVAGAPALRAAAAAESGGGGMLLFSSRDTANHRAPLLLFRDNSSGVLTLRSPFPRPGYPGTGAGAGAMQ
jgi:hypothetical protein